MTLKFSKFLSLNNYIYNFSKIFRTHNFFLNRLTRSIPFDELQLPEGTDLDILSINQRDYLGWVKEFYPELPPGIRHQLHKKILEFYTSYSILNPGPEDVFLDAAGGIYSYLNKLTCRKVYLQDIRISENIKSRLGDDVEYIDCDAGSIPLPDGSVDKISVHHSIEHFQKNSDTLFIKEVQRLLSPRGQCCILPIFITDHLTELTEKIDFNKKFDSGSRRIIDPTNILSGGGSSGSYARIYDLKALEERILNHLDASNFNVSLTEIRYEGKSVPDLSISCHSDTAHIENPYRALVIKRSQ